MNEDNCQQFALDLDDWFDGQLEGAALDRQEAHAHDCAHCAALFDRERGLRRALRQMPAVSARPGFAAAALRAARSADRSATEAAPSGNWLSAFAGAAATASCFAIALWVWQPGGRPDSGVTPVQVVATAPAPTGLKTVSLSVGKVEPMRLRIESPQDFAEVNFSVDLPRHVQIAGQPGIRAITWTGSLSKGENLLELPLVAEDGGSGVLAARVSWGTFERRIETSVVGVPVASQTGVRNVSGKGI